MLFCKKRISNLSFAIVVSVALWSMSSCSSGHDWREHYRNDADSPYGTSIIYRLLDDYFPGQRLEKLSDSLHVQLQNDNTTGTYFYLGPYLWMDSLRVASLLEFVSRGNDAMIIVSDLSPDLLDSISHEYCIDLTYHRDSGFHSGYNEHYFFMDTLAELNFVHPKLKVPNDYVFHFRIRDKNVRYEWDHLPNEIFCEDQDEFASLGTIGDSCVNFAMAKYGKGHFYLHTTPLVFTNFHIVQGPGREYAEKVLSHLKKGPVLWDATKRSFEFPGRNRGFGQSPLKYVLSQPSLAWGWYLLLGMAVLFLLFRAKRRQRMIPVLGKNENTSLEFIETIGRLYFVQSNHRQLALEKMKLFLGFVREHYHLSTRELNDQFKKQLSLKSEVPMPVIEKIFTIYGNIENSKFASENTLVAFHREMDKFYLTCK